MSRKASLVRHDKVQLPYGLIVEVKIWRLPETTIERPHGLKYSLFFGRAGERIIGYDNEAGKGDHRHDRASETAYRFTTLDRLLADFDQDVRQELKKWTK